MTKKDFAADLKVLEKYYDCVRIIDPMDSRRFEDPSVRSWCRSQCFQDKSAAQYCENCISMETIRANKACIKVVNVENEWRLLTAMPLEIDGHIVALELIKCINGDKIWGPNNALSMHYSMSKMNDLAVRDSLIGIYNRRYIDEHLPLEIVRARLHTKSFSLVMADIDYFKKINDQYGHLVGDEVLKLFGERLQNNIRQHDGDWVARYGGEEFLIFLSGCSKKHAYKVVEEIREKIENNIFLTSVGVLNLKASFGVHTFCGEETNLQQLICKVDKLLYCAKQAGRNCTVTGELCKNADIHDPS